MENKKKPNGVVKYKIILVFLIIFVIAAPSHGQERALRKSQVPGDVNDHILLGTAYNSEKKAFRNIQSVTGEISEDMGNSHLETAMEMDLSFKKVVERLSGRLSVETSFPVVKAGAEAYMAKDMTAEDYSSTYTFTVSTTPKKRVLIPSGGSGAYGVTGVGQKYIDEYQADLFDKVGNEFVTAIEYGASLFINMKIDFRNKYDKLNIGGKIHVKYGGIIDAEGSLDYLDENTKKSVRITVRAIQNGGDPLELLKVFPDQIMSCTLENPQPCFDVFQNSVNYAQEDFIKQFDTLDKYNVLGYHTNTYEESGLEELMPQENYPQVTALVKRLQTELDESFQTALLDYERASKMLTMYNQYMSEEQCDAVEDIRDKAYDNARIYSDATIYCYDHPFGNACIDYADEARALIQAYDKNHLSIAGETAGSEKCENARLTALAIGDISVRTYKAYKRNGWAPIFYDSSNPQQGISEWTDCAAASETYGNNF